MAAGRCWVGRVCCSMGEARVSLRAEREQSIVGAGNWRCREGAHQTRRQLSETTASGRIGLQLGCAGPQHVLFWVEFAVKRWPVKILIPTVRKNQSPPLSSFPQAAVVGARASPDGPGFQVATCSSYLPFSPFVVPVWPQETFPRWC